MAYPTCRPWTLPQSYAGATWEGHHTSGFGHSRDSDTVEESNFVAALKELVALSTDLDGTPTVFTVRESHWAVGWVEWIAIHSSNATAIAKATELCEAREEYPILDDDGHSDLEQETADTLWRDCYRTKDRLEYIRAHRSQFDFQSFADLLGCVRGKYFAGYAFELVNS